MDVHPTKNVQTRPSLDKVLLPVAMSGRWMNKVLEINGVGYPQNNNCLVVEPPTIGW